jgi:hypothetical protein
VNARDVKAREFSELLFQSRSIEMPNINLLYIDISHVVVNLDRSRISPTNMNERILPEKTIRRETWLATAEKQN